MLGKKKKAKVVKDVIETTENEEVIAATETDGGIGDEVAVAEIELAKDVSVDE